MCRLNIACNPFKPILSKYSIQYKGKGLSLTFSSTPCAPCDPHDNAAATGPPASRFEISGLDHLYNVVHFPNVERNP